METALLNRKQQDIMAEIPAIRDLSSFFLYLNIQNIDTEFLTLLTDLSGLKHEIISDWLNISPKTIRNYKNNRDTVLKENTKEHILSLLALYKHGIEVFSTKERFEKWLLSENTLLDGKAPLDFLDTITGIKWIDSRLTAIEYGENV